MSQAQVNPTRMELTRLKKKLVTARKGHKLLKDKRDELMRRFMELVKENRILREKVEKGIAQSNKNFALAAAVMSDEEVKTALLAPKQSVSVDASSKNVMSVNVPVFDYKTRTADKNDIFSYGFVSTSADLDSAVQSLSDVFPDMLRLAEEYPMYGWAKNKGYPTKEHRLAIREYGLSPYHRLTFNSSPEQLELF